MFGSAPAVVIGTASGYAVHNLRTGKAEGQNPGGTWPVPRAAAVRAVSDNRLLLSGSTVVVVGEKGDVWTFRGQFARAYTEKHTFIRSGGYEAFTVSPDRTRLAAVTGFGEAVFWEVTGPQPRALPWTVPGPVTFLRYSVDGRTLVVGDDRTLALWDAAAGCYGSVGNGRMRQGRTLIPTGGLYVQVACVYGSGEGGYPQEAPR